MSYSTHILQTCNSALQALQTSRRRRGKLSAERDAPQRQQTKECGKRNSLTCTLKEFVIEDYKLRYLGFEFVEFEPLVVPISDERVCGVLSYLLFVPHYTRIGTMRKT